MLPWTLTDGLYIQLGGPTETLSETAENELLNESLTWAGKLFFSGIASYLGKKDGDELPQIPIKIRASEKELQAILVSNCEECCCFELGARWRKKNCIDAKK